jgi:hypothetical protein
MFGDPVMPPPGAVVLRLHWQYQLKQSGVALMGLLGLPPFSIKWHPHIPLVWSSLYGGSSFALAAANNIKVYGGDATHAFAHSPPPDTPTLSMLTMHTQIWHCPWSTHRPSCH